MKKEISCKTCLKKNIIDKKTFEREIALCKKLSEENGGKCCWGKCQNCGVLPLLHKLHKGEILEDKSLINEIKKKLCILRIKK